MDYSKDAIRELIRQANLTHVGAALERLMKPSIRLNPRPANDDDIPTGASKLGGLPDLPPGIEWPHCLDLPGGPEDWIDKQRLGGPLFFLGQINLADAAEHDAAGDLPTSGLLSFFAALQRDGFPDDGVTPDSWRVRYHASDASALRRTTGPPIPDALRQALEEDSSLPLDLRIRPQALRFSRSYTMPSRPEIGMTAEEATRYREAFWDVFHGDGRPRHQLLGDEGPMQGDTGGMARSCEAAMPHGVLPMEPLPGESWRQWQQRFDRQRDAWENKWRLLLQLDTEPDLKLEWPAWGRGYFWITTDGLISRDFSRVVLVNRHA